MLLFDQDTASLHGRMAIDEDYGGLALDVQGEGCLGLVTGPTIRVLHIGGHGVSVVTDTVADTRSRHRHGQAASHPVKRNRQKCWASK